MQTMPAGQQAGQLVAQHSQNIIGHAPGTWARREFRCQRRDHVMDRGISLRSMESEVQKREWRWMTAPTSVFFAMISRWKRH